MQEKLDEYILSHISPEDDYLYRLYRATQIHLLRPRMASGHLQGQLLRMLCQMIRPQRVLEIGTYSGYSALSMASGMGEGTELVTFEINDEQEDFTRPWLEGSPFPPKIKMIVGDIFSILPEMEGKFDLVFIDANKRQYCEYLDLVLPHLNSGAYIIADNTLWDGHVVDPAYDNDPQTQGVRAFNDRIATDPQFEKIILPLRDGLTIARWLK
ncbi:MAG: O-methyltransferase [Bacteroidaceae bacterium]|nr:O-methyltransferase [Bacteroidaceae bacterium]